MTVDFNHQQMQQLIAHLRRAPVDIDRVHIVYVTAYSDYWENRNEFVQHFAAVPGTMTL